LVLKGVNDSQKSLDSAQVKMGIEKEKSIQSIDKNILSIFDIKNSHSAVAL
jgi:hypothetical protein